MKAQDDKYIPRMSKILFPIPRTTSLHPSLLDAALELPYIPSSKISNLEQFTPYPPAG